MITDISDLKRAEAVLRDQESFYRTILANISDAVFLTDEHGNLVYVCPNVRVILGRSEEDIRGLGNIQAVLGAMLFRPEELPNVGDVTAGAAGMVSEIPPVHIGGPNGRGGGRGMGMEDERWTSFWGWPCS